MDKERKMKRKMGLSPFLGTVPFLLFFIFCFSLFAKAEEGLVGWWKFDEAKGDVGHDSSGNGNDGKIYGAEWLKGKQTLMFDGKDDYVDCGNNSSLFVDGPLTISTWVHTPLLDPGDRRQILSKYGWNFGFVANPGIVRIAFESMDAYGEEWYDIGPTFEKDSIKDRWTYLAVVYSTDKKEVSIYMDGKKIYSVERSDEAIGNCNNFPLLFGKASGMGQIQYFRGIIGETKIYSRDLSAEEIISNYELELNTKKE